MKSVQVLWVVFLTCFLLNPFSRLERSQDGAEPISAANINRLTMVARYGDGAFTGDARWSPNGRQIAVPGSLGVWIYDSETLREDSFIPVPDSYDIAWSPAGDHLAVAAPTATEIWDTIHQRLVQSYQGAYKVAYSPDNAFLVLTQHVPYGNTGLDWRPLFAVISLATQETIGLIPGESYSDGEALFTSSSQYLLTWSLCYQPGFCDQPGLFQLWDMHLSLPLYSAVDLPDDLATGDVFEASTLTVLSDGRIAFAHESAENGATQTITLLAPLMGEQQDFQIPARWSHLFAVGSNLGIASHASDGSVEIQVMNAETGSIVQTTYGAAYPVNFAASPLDEHVLVMNDSHQLQIGHLGGSELTQIRSTVLSSGTSMLSPAQAAALQTPTGQCVRLERSDPESHCGIFSPDGTQFLGTDVFGSVYVWETSTRRGHRLIDVSTNDIASAFTFSGDSVRLSFSVADCLMSGRCLSSEVYFASQTGDHVQSEPILGTVSQLVFAPADPEDSLIAAVTDASVVFYDTNTAQTLLELEDHRTVFTRSAFSDNGTLFLTRSIDDTVRLWAVPHQN